MNDIEILEWVCINKLYIDTHNECDYHNIHTAIENLIQRNKDLEQIEKEHKEENGRLREENEVLRYGLRENKILRHGLEENTEEIDKLYKIINEMAEDLMHIGLIPYRENIFTKEQLIEQYANKVEEDK